MAIWALCLVSETALAYEEVGTGRLRLRFDKGKGQSSLFYGGELIAYRVAEFEVRTLAGQQAGRSIPGLWQATADIQVRGSTLALKGKDEQGNTYEIRMTIEGDETLAIDAEMTPGNSWRSGKVQFNLGRFVADWLIGREIHSKASVLSETTTLIPVAPLPMESRYIVQDAEQISLNANIFDLDIASRKESKISMADLRSTGWDKRGSFLYYSSRIALLPAKAYKYSYRVQFRPPSEATKPVPQQSSDIGTPLRRKLHATTHENISKVIPIRAQLLEISRPFQKDLALFKRYIKALVENGANTIVFYHRPEHVSMLRNRVGSDNDWTYQELKELRDFAITIGAKPVPGMTTHFSAKDFPKIVPSNAPTDSFYCISAKEAYETLFGLYETLLELYPAELLLIGHDEIKNIMSCARPGETPAKLFADDVNKIRNWLAQRGVRAALWGDMLLDHGAWEDKVGSAHSLSPIFGNANLAPAIDLLFKDIVIIDWHYEFRTSYESIRYFRNKGFSVWGATWYDVYAADSMVDSLRRYEGQGVLGTDWGFWRTFSPAATTLFPIRSAALMGVKAEPEELVADLAEKIREPIATDKYIPIAIMSGLNANTMDHTALDGHGCFDLGPTLDLRNLPVGLINLRGIEFNILPANKDNMLCSMSKGRSIAQSNRIAIAPARYRYLAILHASHIANPQMRPRKIGAYRIYYSDGNEAEIPLYEGVNVTDFRSSASVRQNDWGFGVGIQYLLRAYPGYFFQSRSGDPLNTQVIVWKNPYGDREISSIELSVASLDTRVAIGSFAISGAK
jgi:hypothetical protein